MTKKELEQQVTNLEAKLELTLRQYGEMAQALEKSRAEQRSDREAYTSLEKEHQEVVDGSILTRNALNILVKTVVELEPTIREFYEEDPEIDAEKMKGVHFFFDSLHRYLIKEIDFGEADEWSGWAGR